MPESTAAKVLLAADVIAERGLDGTKIEELASVTGVPKATLYYYFEGKEGILSHIFGVVLDALEVAVRDGVAVQGDAAHRLRRVIANHVEVFRRYPSACQALHFDIGRATRRPDLATRNRAAYLQPVSTLISQGITEGTFRDVPDPYLAALSVFGATTTTAIHVIAVEPASLDEVADTVAAVVLAGLQAERRRG
ncbi:MAG: TetR/AcrR family transcriptional regulator [Mycobacterium sp.]